LATNPLTTTRCGGTIVLQGWSKRMRALGCESIAPKRLGSPYRAGRTDHWIKVKNQALNCSDADLAAKIIQDALSIESDGVANCVFPKTWPIDREQCARIIGEWLQTEVRFID
jgi:hypothetical protein